jgi:hypothetical protein
VIPDHLHDRWAPMWRDGTVRGRPWWRYVQYYGTNPKGESQPGYVCQRADGRSVWVAEDAIPGGLAVHDEECPLPPPPQMPGQVWVRDDGREQLITGAINVGLTPCWPPPGEVLVAGPTPWGRDVPWADCRPERP